MTGGGRNNETQRTVDALAGPQPWMTHAACAHTHWPDQFYPDTGDHLTTEKARRICSRCPVAVECLSYALTHDEQTGIWGGLGPGQRTTLQRKRGAA